jgi:hypothetical protein
MAIARQIKEEFVKLREIDGATLSICAEQLGIGIATANRWPHEPWYEEMARTVRLARDEAIAESARAAAKGQAASLVDTQTEWTVLRRRYIQRVRATAESAVVALERISQQITDPESFRSPSQFKTAVEAHGKLSESVRKLLLIEHEEKLALASVRSSEQQRLTPEEIACLSPDQLEALVDYGLEEEGITCPRRVGVSSA